MSMTTRPSRGWILDALLETGFAWLLGAGAVICLLIALLVVLCR